jgi:S1-C subfamily serine protease
MTDSTNNDAWSGDPGLQAERRDVGAARRPPRVRHHVRLTTALTLCVISALASGAVTASVGSMSTGPAAVGVRTVDQHPATAAAMVTSAAGSEAAVSGAEGETLPVGEIAKQVGPAVVAILTGGSGSSGSADFSPQGAGSGVIVDADGLILTNRHVVGDGGALTVFLDDGRSFEGTLEGVDTLTDLALLSIAATRLPSARLGDSSSVEVGDLAVAIGNPEGDLPGSVTAGIVSALEREIVVGDLAGIQAPEALRHLIQHDAAINPGNSGGPLVAGDGSVVGINTAIAGGSQGIGFAIPINLAKPIVKQVLAGDPIRRPYIGIFFTEVDAQLAQDERLPVTSGVIVRGGAASDQPGVIAGGPADRARLRDGDILTAIDGQPIDATHQLDVALLEHEPGDVITLTVLRGDRTLKRDVTLGIRPGDVQ